MMRRGLRLLAALAVVASAMVLAAGQAGAATQRAAGPGIDPCLIYPGLCGSFCVYGVTVHPGDLETAFSLWLRAIHPDGGDRVEFGACAGPTPPPPQGPDRYIYCAGAGDVGADGKPLGVGQTLNLKFGEQVGSPFFPNATLGFWVEGVGLTCQLTPEQAALAATSTVKVNHTGAPNSQEGAPVYTYVHA
jgi:hypothetical protein